LLFGAASASPQKAVSVMVMAHGCPLSPVSRSRSDSGVAVDGTTYKSLLLGSGMENLSKPEAGCTCIDKPCQRGIHWPRVTSWRNPLDHPRHLHEPSARLEANCVVNGTTEDVRGMDSPMLVRLQKKNKLVRVRVSEYL